MPTALECCWRVSCEWTCSVREDNLIKCPIFHHTIDTFKELLHRAICFHAYGAIDGQTACSEGTFGYFEPQSLEPRRFPRAPPIESIGDDEGLGWSMMEQKLVHVQ